MTPDREYSLSVSCGCGATFATSGPYWPYLEAWMTKAVTEHLASCQWLRPVLLPGVTP